MSNLGILSCSASNITVLYVSTTGFIYYVPSEPQGLACLKNFTEMRGLLHYFPRTCSVPKASLSAYKQLSLISIDIRKWQIAQSKAVPLVSPGKSSQGARHHNCVIYWCKESSVCCIKLPATIPVAVNYQSICADVTNPPLALVFHDSIPWLNSAYVSICPQV